MISYIKKRIKIAILKAKIRELKVYGNPYLDLTSFYEGYNTINDACVISNCLIGLGTYISANSKLQAVKIGRFCSIGKDVSNNLALHPSENFVSTHPAFFSTKMQAGFTFVKKDIFEEHKYADSGKKYLTVIGNDVWIGNKVLIMDGVTIGDGAIVGAGALVTKDVEPYAIVGGIPAKIIKRRFETEDINFLNSFKWWEKSIDEIKTLSKYFNNIDSLKHFIND
ncbi:MAG: CatB-related O-acetyltransferase [Bacteroidia bacterium]|nr:CatB-related O-acetyltransferase [Bacteroidia bacterium]